MKVSWIVLVLLVGILVLTLTACGGGDSDTSDAGTPNMSTVTRESSAATIEPTPTVDVCSLAAVGCPGFEPLITPHPSEGEGFGD